MIALAHLRPSIENLLIFKFNAVNNNADHAPAATHFNLDISCISLATMKSREISWYGASYWDPTGSRSWSYAYPDRFG